MNKDTKEIEVTCNEEEWIKITEELKVLCNKFQKQIKQKEKTQEIEKQAKEILILNINNYIRNLINDQRDIDCQHDFIKFLEKLNDGEFNNQNESITNNNFNIYDDKICKIYKIHHENNCTLIENKQCNELIDLCLHHKECKYCYGWLVGIKVEKLNNDYFISKERLLIFYDNLIVSLLEKLNKQNQNDKLVYWTLEGKLKQLYQLKEKIDSLFLSNISCNCGKANSNWECEDCNHNDF